MSSRSGSQTMSLLSNMPSNVGWVVEYRRGGEV